MIAVILVVVLILLTDPFMNIMPPMAAMGALLCAAILLVMWSGFVMYESAADEREAMHRMNAGRVAYLSGVAVLTVALIVQGLSHQSDPWIAGALAIMVLSKLAARIFYDSHG